MSQENSSQLNDAINDSWGTYGGKSKRKSSHRKNKDLGWGSDKNVNDWSGNRTFTMGTADSKEQSGSLVVVEKINAKSELALTDGRYLDLIRANTKSAIKYYLILVALVSIEVALFILFSFSILPVIIIITLFFGIVGGLSFRHPSISYEIRKKLKDVYKEEFVDYVLKSDYNAERIDPNPEIIPSFLPRMIYKDKDENLHNSSFNIKSEWKIVRQHLLKSGAPIQFLQYEYVKSIALSVNEATQNYLYSDVTQYACSIAVIPIKTTFNTYLRVAQFSTPLLPGMAEVRAKNNIYPPLSNNQRYNCNFLMDEFKENTFDTCAQPDEKADLIERFYDIDPSYRSSLTCAPKCRDPQNLYIKSDDFMQALVDAMSDIRAKVQLFFIESTVYIVFNLGNDALNPHDDDLKNKKLNGSDVLLRVRNELDEMIPFCQKISDALEQLPEIA